MERAAALRATFHLGLVLALSALVLVIGGVFNKGLSGIIRLDTAMIYVAAALLHMVALAAVARATDDGQRRKGVGYLYTAGFVHTLIALGVAIAIGGAALMEGGAIGPTAVGMMLFPMGAAVLPHAVGVWIGQDIEAGLADEESAKGVNMMPGTRIVRNDETFKEAAEDIKAQVRLMTDMCKHLTDIKESATGAYPTASVKEAADLMRNQVKLMREICKQLGELKGSATAASADMARIAKALGEASSDLVELGPEAKKMMELLNRVPELFKRTIELFEENLFETPR